MYVFKAGNQLCLETSFTRLFKLLKEGCKAQFQMTRKPACETTTPVVSTYALKKYKQVTSP